MQPTISIPQHWGYPRFDLEQRTQQGIILGLYYYPSGTQWKHECWLYTVICGDEIVHATEHQIIGTGQLETLAVQKPAFVLGEKVILCSYGDDTKQRLILGVVLVDKFWFYLVELVSPALIKTPIMFNRFSLVGEKSLVRVNA